MTTQPGRSALDGYPSLAAQVPPARTWLAHQCVQRCQLEAPYDGFVGQPFTDDSANTCSSPAAPSPPTRPDTATAATARLASPRGRAEHDILCNTDHRRPVFGPWARHAGSGAQARRLTGCGGHTQQQHKSGSRRGPARSCLICRDSLFGSGLEHASCRDHDAGRADRGSRSVAIARKRLASGVRELGWQAMALTAGSMSTTGMKRMPERPNVSSTQAAASPTTCPAMASWMNLSIDLVVWPSLAGWPAR